MWQVTGRKRARDDSAENTAAELGLSLPDEGRKKARTGWAGSQWITVYVKRKPMKQRCAPHVPPLAVMCRQGAACVFDCAVLHVLLEVSIKVNFWLLGNV